MKKQYTIADVLHYAADKCLAYDERYTADGIKERYSCLAIEEAIRELNGTYDVHQSKRIMSGLKKMGIDPRGRNLFVKYGDNPDVYEDINHEAQGMRYMWLKWAALMAEEQGV